MYHLISSGDKKSFFFEPLLIPPTLTNQAGLPVKFSFHSSTFKTLSPVLLKVGGLGGRII